LHGSIAKRPDLAAHDQPGAEPLNLEDTIREVIVAELERKSG
jgi:hypothetical protein